MNFVGIDVSGKSFLMQVNTEHKRGQARCFDNTSAGHKAALKALKGVKGPVRVSLSANIPETLAPLGITVGRWKVKTNDWRKRHDDIEWVSCPRTGG